jgi:hypothetical protein
VTAAVSKRFTTVPAELALKVGAQVLLLKNLAPDQVRVVLFAALLHTVAVNWFFPT